MALLLLASCATVPRTAPPPDVSARFAALDPGGLVYLWADVPAARPILDRSSFAGFNGKQTAELLDKTGSAAAAVYPPESGRRFMAAAQGAYPAFGAEMSFFFSSTWKKRKSESGGGYWHSAREGLSVALDSKKALVSDGDPFSRRGKTPVPPALEEMSGGAVLLGWIASAGEPINRFLASLEIPLQIPAEMVLFALYPADGEGRYQAALRLETPSTSQVRALSSIITLLRLFLPPPREGASASPDALLAAVFANPPAVDGTALVLKSAPMEAEAIALLFNMFQVYSH